MIYKKFYFSTFLLLLLSIAQSFAQGQFVNIHATYNGVNYSNNATITINDPDDCLPIVFEAGYTSGSITATALQIDIDLLFNGQPIASSTDDGVYSQAIPLAVTQFDPLEMELAPGTYTVRYRYRTRRCFGPFCFGWNAWQTIVSQPININMPVGFMTPLFANLPLQACANNPASGNASLQGCGSNATKASITPPGGSKLSIVYNQGLNGPNTPQIINFQQVASDLGINLSSGTYQFEICPQVRYNNVVLAEKCFTQNVSFGCCAAAPNNFYYLTDNGNTCPGHTFYVYLQNAQAGVTYTYSTSHPGMSITKVSNTTALVSTSPFTPSGLAPISISANNCAGSNQKTDFIIIQDPNSPNCFGFRLAEDDASDRIQIGPNPMTSKASLRFDLEEATEVEMELLNAMGQRVAQPLAAQTLTAGAQEILISR
ncbi:MAG: hypothetical protein AAF206_29200, partial [Bacteroidota bacterium]